MDGLEACRAMRADSEIPIIMLTVRNAEKDKVRALDAGADDYIVKPFGIQELLARVRAALRRSSNDEAEPVIVSKELSFDFEKRTISVRGKPVHLTPKESASCAPLGRSDKSQARASSVPGGGVESSTENA
jgi:two-component system, OmpR family, KDP operon response regulator KdpE